MPCYHPIRGWRSREVNPETGRLRVVFSPDGFTRPEDSILIPCGKCVGCKMERSRQWSVRIMHDVADYDYGYFLTLTYADDRETTLHPPHLTNFWKRLRNRVSNHKVRYFACGEYGEQFLRPHYHACLWGTWQIPDLIKYKQTEAGHWLLTSEMLEKIWLHGQVFIGQITPESAAYVAGYVEKKGMLDMREYGLEPEFVRMSRTPPIGRAHVEKYLEDIYKDDTVVVSGMPRKPPRYYDKYLEEVDSKQLKEVKEKRLEKAYKKAVHSDRLKAAEKIQTQRRKTRGFKI